MAAKNGKASIVAVLGDPIAHSLSPAIHEYWLTQYDINGAYIPIRAKQEDFAQLLQTLVKCGFVGFNITMPHKYTAYRLMNKCDDIANACQAVNTIIVQQDGQLYGCNSDVFGFQQLLHQAYQQPVTSDDTVLLIGAGGAAKAVILGLHKAGFENLIIANRNQDNAMHAGAIWPNQTKLQIISLEESVNAAKHVRLIVNTLAYHVIQAVDYSELVAQSQQDSTIIDISYGVDGTALTQTASQMNRRTCDGLNMLLWQAQPGFEAWFGVKPNIDKQLEMTVRQTIC